MPSKYSGVLDGLPKFSGDDADYQFRVDQTKEKFTEHSPMVLAGTYREIRAEKDALNELLSEVQLRLTAVEQLLGDAYEAEGLTKITLATGENIATQLMPLPQVEDPEAFRLWCLANGYEREMRLHPSTAAALVKTRLLNGDPEPPGIKLFVKTTVVLRRG